MQQAGAAPIKAAQNEVDAAYAKFASANAAIQAEKDKVNAEQAKINNLCEEEEETSVELLEAGMVVDSAKKASRRAGSRRLLGASLSDVEQRLQSSDLYSPRPVNGAAADELSDVVKLAEVKDQVQAKWGHRHHWCVHQNGRAPEPAFAPSCACRGVFLAWLNTWLLQASRSPLPPLVRARPLFYERSGTAFSMPIRRMLDCTTCGKSRGLLV